MKYGLKTILRTPVKTVLFMVLIMAVAAFLSLGVGMWRSSENMLAEADAVFKTAGEFVYTLGYYPNSELYDPELVAARQAFNLHDYVQDGALLVEDHSIQRAYVEGFMPVARAMPYRDYAVLTINVLNYTENDTELYCRVVGVHYVSPSVGTRGMVLMDGMTVNMAPYEGDGLWLQPGRRYVIFGEIGTRRNSRILDFRPASFTEELHIPAAYGYCPPVFDVTHCDKMEFWESEAGAYFQKAIDTLYYINASVDMVISWDISAVSAFHRGEYSLAEGSFPTEHKGGANACVIPQRMAAQLGCGVGDQISLSIHYPTGPDSRYDSYWPDTGFAAQTTFTVSGIYQTEALISPIYVLDTGQSWIGVSESDYTLARVVIDNRTAEAYMAAMTDILPVGVRLDLYNQGYTAATRAVYSMRETARMITAVCGVVGLAVLWFFAFLFVYRNDKNVNLLLRLGTTARRVLLFLLTGSGVTVFFAAAVGSIGGFLVSRQVIDAVYQAAEAHTVYDYRYSILGGTATDKIFTPTTQVTVGVCLIVTAMVCGVALFLCVLLGLLVIRKQNPHYRLRRLTNRIHKHKKQRTDTPHWPNANSPPVSAGPRRGFGFMPVYDHIPPCGAIPVYDRIPGVSLRYIVKSILRGGRRSLTVPVLVAVLLIFVFMFTGVRERYRARLAGVYEEIPVSLWFTSQKGTQRDNLVIEKQQLLDLAQLPYISTVWHSLNQRYMFLGRTARGGERLEADSQTDGITDGIVDGIVDEIVDGIIDGITAEALPENFVIPRGGYSYATFVSQIERHTAPFVVSVDFTKTPEFQLVSDPQITWLEGMNPTEFAQTNLTQTDLAQTNLTQTDDRVFNCLVSQPFLLANDLRLGDTIAVSVFFIDESVEYFDESGRVPYWDNYRQLLKIVGVYVSEINRNAVFVPDNIITDAGAETNADTGTGAYTYYNAGGCIVGDPSALSLFKDWLTDYYDEVGQAGRHRRWVVIDDKALYNTIDSLTRHIGYMDLLYPFMLAAVAVIGFVASGLLLKSRAGEITALRSLGAGKMRVFCSFFFEPVLLSLPGVIVGLGVSMVLLGGWSYVTWSNIPLLAVSFYAGVAGAVAHTYRKAVMQSYGAEEA